jgi:hypothetical protein
MTAALHPEADIGLNLPERSANDPKPTFAMFESGSSFCELVAMQQVSIS